jgi:hypothetical protein
LAGIVFAPVLSFAYAIDLLTPGAVMPEYALRFLIWHFIVLLGCLWVLFRSPRAAQSRCTFFLP